ncbi:MAG: hypothetical protein QM764_13555 [Chitinophagaceae bacterium]
MKKLIIILIMMNSAFAVQAQLKVKPKCDDFNVDILSGTVNTMRPDYTYGMIKEKLPCFTSTDAEGTAGTKCGATIFFKDRDVYFYTDRDYIEIGEKFKGKMSMPLFATMRKGVFKYLGRPMIKDDNWDAFETSYGLVILHYNKAGKVSLIQMTTKSSQTLQLCE